MASAGKMIFDVSPSVIDRDFAEAHPNVRQGPHALLTITEGKAANKRGACSDFLYRLTEKEDAKATTDDHPVIGFGDAAGPGTRMRRLPLDGGGSAGRHNDQNPPAVLRGA
jgi:hypothetical protein